MTLRMKRYKRLRYTGNSQQCLNHHNHSPVRKRRSRAGFPPWEQSVENPHRMKENLLWERKIAFLHVACKIPHLRVLQFLRTKILSWRRLGNYQMLTVKYFHLILYLFLQNDEYADLKLNFFFPKRTMEPSSWWCLAFTDGPSDGVSHCTVNGQCASTTSSPPTPRRRTIWIRGCEDSALVPGHCGKLWPDFTLVDNFPQSLVQKVDVISSNRKGCGSKGKPKRSMPLDRSAWQAVSSKKHPPVPFFLVHV